jgi:alpha-L-arabinofuranosidase
LNFTAAENGTAIGTVGISFSTINADSFELDDVSLTQLNTDPTNTTVFRDGVVNALRTLQPGIIRYWGGNGQLGETLDNLLTPSFGRQRGGFITWNSVSNQQDYGLHDFLVLCQTIGAEPWFVVPSTFSTTDAANLIQYLSGGTKTPYGAKRAALGQTKAWTQVFPTIHLEFGNEEWNSTFMGGAILYSQPDGQEAQTIFAAMQANPSYIRGTIDFVLGGQAASPGLNNSIQNYVTNNTSFSIAPYMMNTVDSFSNNQDLFGSGFAEPEAFMSSASSTSAEGFTPGLVYEDSQALQLSSHPTPLSYYEINMSTIGGAITQQALNSYVSSLGAGLMVTDTMLQSIQQYGIVNQALFALPQWEFTRPDHSNVFLWGAVIDMGVTNRKRPQYLALQLANQAIGMGAQMLQTVQTGANPTWNQPLVNTVQFTGAHYLQSYAFQQGSKHSAIVYNLSLTSALPVTFAGTHAPAGTVQMQQLTSANPTDTNETANVVNIASFTLPNFSSSVGLTLPPYSMTVLTW